MGWLTRLQVNSADAELLQFVGAKLAAILDASDKFVGEAVDPPVPGSSIDRAYRENVREAFDTARLLMYAVEDHLRTILMVVNTGPLPSFALYTLLRAAADAAVRCRHLLDPEISETDRLGRALNERLDNLEEQRKVIPDDSEQWRHYHERVEHLEKRAISHGVQILRERKKDGSTGNVTGFGEALRSDVDLFEKYVPAGSTAFRFLSAHVHSKPWVQTPRHKATPGDQVGISYVATDLDVALFTAVLDGIVALHDENIAAWMQLAGYPADVWLTAKQGPDSPPAPRR